MFDFLEGIGELNRSYPKRPLEVIFLNKSEKDTENVFFVCFVLLNTKYNVPKSTVLIF